MTDFIKRPGAALATRPLHFFWIVDCSGSMYGEKIAAVNTAIEETIPEMRDSAENNPQAQLLIRALAFSSGARWLTGESVPVDQYRWTPMQASGMTDFGEALNLVADELTIPPMSTRALPPVLVLLSDGQPTGEYKTALKRLLQLPWGKKAVRIAIAIGQDADENLLEEFTGNPELILKASTARGLTRAIRWASTVAAQVSMPVNNRVDDESKTVPIHTAANIDLSSIPDDLDDDVGDDVF